MWLAPFLPKSMCLTHSVLNYFIDAIHCVRACTSDILNTFWTHYMQVFWCTNTLCTRVPFPFLLYGSHFVFTMIYFLSLQKWRDLLKFSRKKKSYSRDNNIIYQLHYNTTLTFEKIWNWKCIQINKFLQKHT